MNKYLEMLQMLKDEETSFSQDLSRFEMACKELKRVTSSKAGFYVEYTKHCHYLCGYILKVVYQDAFIDTLGFMVLSRTGKVYVQGFSTLTFMDENNRMGYKDYCHILDTWTYTNKNNYIDIYEKTMSQESL